MHIKIENSWGLEIVVLPLLPVALSLQNKSESNGGLSVFIKVEMELLPRHIL
jgi:hypothetical protein